jgi:hypothetical protein
MVNLSPFLRKLLRVQKWRGGDNRVFHPACEAEKLSPCEQHICDINALEVHFQEK